MKQRRHRKKNWDKHFYIHTYKHASHTTVILRTDSLPHQHFLHNPFYAKKMLHTNTFTHKHFYTPTHLQTHLHANVFTHSFFTHKHLYTQPFYTQTLFNTQTFLHTNALNADVFTHKKNYTQALVHANPLPGPTKLEETHRFGHSNIISCKRVAAGPTKLARNLSLKNCFKQNTSCLLCWFNDVER